MEFLNIKSQLSEMAIGKMATAGYRVFLTLFLMSLLCVSKSLFAQDIPGIPDNIPVDPNEIRNIPPDQLQSILQDINQRNQKSGEDLHKPDQEDQTIPKDSIVIDTAGTNVPIISRTFGADLFRNTQILQLAELSTPPDDYRIGVGDHLVVSLWGGADLEQDYIVARDGSIFPRGLGKITVQGLTFTNARAVIYDRFRRVVPDGTNISISMGQPRSVVVQVTGNVVNPGPKVVSAFTNAMNVIALSGGTTSYGDLRNIQISRNGKIIDSIDVYEYLLTGNFGKQIYLENNDFIIVPMYHKKVQATGQFRRPMYYQLKQDEGMNDLIRFAGGFTSDAYVSAIAVIRNQDEKQIIKTVDFNKPGTEQQGTHHGELLYDGDVVAVNVINPGIRNKAEVMGEVAYPNVYEVRPGDRLFDLINRAGGLTANSFLDKAYVLKGAADSNNINPQRIGVNLKNININLNDSNNIPIDPNDIIQIFGKRQFEDAQKVTITGEVRKPGEYTRYSGMTLKDLLYFAGGLRPTAEFGSIHLSRVVDLDSATNGFTPTNTVVQTFSVNENLGLDSATEKIKLHPFDQVIVRKNPKFQLQKNVRIDGWVLYPGPYPKLIPSERMSSFVKRAGGLTENSNPDGAVLFRIKDSVSNKLSPFSRDVFIIDSLGHRIYPQTPDGTSAVSIHLGDALRHPGSKYDLELIQGDLLYIPALNPVVTVSGAVQNALKISFDKTHDDVKFYVDKAGGFGIRPWRKRIFVTYPDGTSRKTKNFGFLHFYPKVKSGSVVTVPQRPEGRAFGNISTQVLFTALPTLFVYLLTRIK